MSDCNLNSCKQENKIYELQKELHELKTKQAVSNNTIETIKGDIRDVKQEIEILISKLEARFDKLTSYQNKLVWFNMTTSVGMLGNLILNLL